MNSFPMFYSACPLLRDSFVKRQQVFCHIRNIRVLKNLMPATNNGRCRYYHVCNPLKQRILFRSPTVQNFLTSQQGKLRYLASWSCLAPKHLDSTRYVVNHSQSCLSSQTLSRGLSFSAKAIVEASPPKIQPYLQLCRLDRPVGTWLVYLPCTWSIALAASPGCLPNIKLLALFGLGSFLMRGAGCTINDIWDKDIDRQVGRTCSRPLPSGRLTNYQALSFCGLQLSAALAILLTFDWYSILLGASSVLLITIYPLMKRVTFWPHVFLGLTLNWGVLLGWAVVHGACDWGLCLPLYMAGVLYTVIYDTIYAHGDKEDDKVIGVKSAALYLGDQTPLALSGLGVLMVSCLTWTGLMVDQTWPYYIGIAGVAVHLAHQILAVNLEDPANVAKSFRSSKYLGIILFAGIVLGNLLKPYSEEGNQSKEVAES